MVSRGDDCSLGDLVAQSGAFSPNISVQIERYGYADPSLILKSSVIVPVHNQEMQVEANLRSIRQCMELSHEIIVIVDGCTDRTGEIVREWALQVQFDDKTTGITIAIVKEGVFETISDSIGAVLACGEYLIEVQADMRIWDIGFDRVLISSLELSDELIAVGGRGAHSFRLAAPFRRRSATDILARSAREAFTMLAKSANVYYPTRPELHLSDSIGRVGDLIECRMRVSDQVRPLFVHETIMRGPLVVRRSDFEALGGYDTRSFFLGNDDHDFAMRALVQLRRRVGYVPIGFDSPMAAGTTRAVKQPQEEARFRELSRYYASRFPDSALAVNSPKINSPQRYVLRVPMRVNV